MEMMFKLLACVLISGTTLHLCFWISTKYKFVAYVVGVTILTFIFACFLCYLKHWAIPLMFLEANCEYVCKS